MDDYTQTRIAEIQAELGKLHLKYDSHLLAAIMLSYSAVLYKSLVAVKLVKAADLDTIFTSTLQCAQETSVSTPKLVQMYDGKPITKQ